MPGARWFEGTSLNYAEHVFAGKDDERGRDPPRLRAARARRADLGRAARPGRRGGRRPAGARGRARRPGRRLPAEHPGGDRRLPRHRLDRRDLVELLARLRPGQRHRPLRPDRAQGALRGRRLQLRRQALRPPRGARRAAGGDAEPRAHVVLPYLDPDPDLARAARRDPLGGAAGERRGRRARVRAGPLRPPALGPLLLGDDRPAEGDRPGPGRDPARAPEEAQPPRRRPPRRPPLLVHDDRLDDVELHRLRPADRGGDRPLRRQPRLPGHGRALGPRRARRDHDVRHQRLLHRRLHEGRGRARRRARPRAPEGGRLDRQPAGAGGLRLDLRAARRRHLALLDQRRHRPLHRLRRRRLAAARSTAASSRRGRWAPRSRPGTRTASR